MGARTHKPLYSQTQIHRAHDSVRPTTHKDTRLTLSLHRFRCISSSLFSTVNLRSIVFSSGCVCVTGHVCTLSLVLLQRAGTAVCTRSVCMVCESVSRAESVRESDRRRKRELCVCMFGPGAGTCVCPWAGNAGIPGLSSASC